MSIPRDGVLQIVPHLPGTFDGVGDYALNLARALSADHGIDTTFLVAGKTQATSRDDFAVISGLHPGHAAQLARDHEHVILHYVNYGYQSRGVPFSLRHFVGKLRPLLRGRWITTFHELYASGPPWKSAFWLRPFQVGIARDMIATATCCIVSNPSIEKKIRAHDPGKQIRLVPVMSNFGEPRLDDLVTRSPRRWTICGGTELIARSLRLFEDVRPHIPSVFAPGHLDVVGGRDEASITSAMDRLKREFPVHHYPEIGVDLASEVLRQCSFGFIDYFGAGKVWPGMVLKSTAFAALCAHGVVPVLYREGAIVIQGEPLPGPYYLGADGAEFPSAAQVPETRRRCYDWYQANAHSRRAASIYAEALA